MLKTWNGEEEVASREFHDPSLRLYFRKMYCVKEILVPSRVEWKVPISSSISTIPASLPSGNDPLSTPTFISVQELWSLKEAIFRPCLSCYPIRTQVSRSHYNQLQPMKLWGPSGTHLCDLLCAGWLFDLQELSNGR